MDWDKAIGDSFNETNATLSGKTFSLCKLSDETIASIAPKQLDKENLMKILSVVKDATLSNEKKAEAINRISGSLDILIGLIGKLL